MTEANDALKSCIVVFHVLIPVAIRGISRVEQCASLSGFRLHSFHCNQPQRWPVSLRFLVRETSLPPTYLMLRVKHRDR